MYWANLKMTSSDLCPNFSDNTYLDSIRLEIPQALLDDFFVVMYVWAVYLMPPGVTSDCIHAVRFQRSSRLQEQLTSLWSA